MNNSFKRGTPGFGILVGCVFTLTGALAMWIGFKRTLLLIALFAIGYFIGAVKDKKTFVKNTVNRVVPEKNGSEPIDFRREVERDQESLKAQIRGNQANENPEGEE